MRFAVQTSRGAHSRKRVPPGAQACEAIMLACFAVRIATSWGAHSREAVFLIRQDQGDIA